MSSLLNRVTTGLSKIFHIRKVDKKESYTEEDDTIIDDIIERHATAVNVSDIEQSIECKEMDCKETLAEVKRQAEIDKGELPLHSYGLEAKKKVTFQNPFASYHPLSQQNKNDAKNRKKLLDEDVSTETLVRDDDDILFIPPFLTKDKGCSESIAFERHYDKIPQGYLHLQEQTMIISNYIRFCDHKQHDLPECQSTTTIHSKLVKNSYFKRFAERTKDVGSFLIKPYTVTCNKAKGKKWQTVYKRTMSNQTLHPLTLKYPFSLEDKEHGYLVPQPFRLHDAIVAKFHFISMYDIKLPLTIGSTFKETCYKEYNTCSYRSHFEGDVEPLLLHDIASSMFIQQKLLGMLLHVDMLEEDLNIIKRRLDMVQRNKTNANLGELNKDKHYLATLKNRLQQKSDDAQYVRDCKQSIVWTFDAFLCSADDVLCELPYNTQVIPIKEAIPITYMPWTTFFKKTKCPELQSLLSICHYVTYMQSVFVDEEFVHGSMCLDVCMFSHNETHSVYDVKVSNYSKTFLRKCVPVIISEDHPYLKQDKVKVHDFTYQMAYGERKSFTILQKWYDILCFINSIRTTLNVKQSHIYTFRFKTDDQCKTFEEVVTNNTSLK